MTASAVRPMPTPTSLSSPFWDAAAQRRLIVQKCTSCARFQWTPQVACPVCLTETLEWTEVTGLGRIYSFSIVERPQSAAFCAPYVVAIVTLDERVDMLCDIVSDLESIRVGARVGVAFDEQAAMPLYHFRVVE